ncbi:MAG: MarR family transcriptional regulator [Pseudomonadota bacterium]
MEIKRSRKQALPVNGLEAHAGFWLRFVSNHVSAGFSRLLEGEGISVSEWVALRRLFDAGEAAPAELMSALGMTKGAISKVVTRLEEKGLVTRVALDDDARARKISLAATGRSMVPRLAALADQNDDVFFGPLSASRRAQLVDILKELVDVHQLRQIPLS